MNKKDRINQQRSYRFAVPFFIFCFFLFIFPGGILFAQETPSEEPVFLSPVSSENGASLEKAMSDLALWPVVSGDFVQENTVKRLSRTFRSEGEFLFAQNDGIIWMVQSPGNPFKIVMDQRGAVTIDSLGNIHKPGNGRENPASKRLTGAMMSLFAGDLSVLEKDFKLYYKKEADGSSTVGLIPKNGTWRKSIKALVLNGGETLNGFTVYSGNGDISTYSFKVKKRGKVITDDQKALFEY